MHLKQIIKSIREEEPEIRSIFLVGCGGSLADLYPAKYLLESETERFNIGYYSSNEFVHATPKLLNEKSIVIVCSHEGQTPETVEAAAISKKIGAKTIAITNKPNSSLAQNGNYVVLYDWGDESHGKSCKMGVVLEIAFEILKQFEDYANYEKAQDAFDKIGLITEKAVQFAGKRADEFAEKYKDEKIFYVMSSGPSYGNAYAYSICLLMEMQWINASGIHSGEYFHGPFEITDREVPFIVLINEGRTRTLDERALKFLKSYGEKLIILDAKELGLNTIDDSVIEFFNPMLFTCVLREYAEKLAIARKHPLSQRRYMWKLEY